MTRYLKLCQQHKEIMSTKNVIVCVYTNASGFLWSMSKMCGTDLGWSNYHGNCEESGAFKTYEDALEDALKLVEGCDLKCFVENRNRQSGFHWSNYADFARNFNPKVM